jgi:caa(3)-type oxidase subunit IV
VFSLNLAPLERITILVVLATIKASLVVAYYMHLRYEPRWIALIPLGGLALVAVLVAALTSTSAHP